MFDVFYCCFDQHSDFIYVFPGGESKFLIFTF